MFASGLFLIFEHVAQQPDDDVRSEAVVKRRNGGVVFPQRAGRQRHVVEVAFDVVEDFLHVVVLRHHVKTQIYQIVFEERKEKNPCALCAKMRKGALNETALSLGCTKIAYAHHKDDFIETSVMNLFMEGRYECFPPVTQLDKTGLQVLRPMLYVDERDVIGFTRKYALPVVANPCPADGKTRREDVKQFIRDSRATFPKIRESLFSAVTGLFDKEG